MLMTVLLVVVILALVGALPTWPHSRSWGYYPSGGLGLVVIILIILLLPLFILLGGWTGSQIHESLAMVNGKVRMANELLHPEKTGSVLESIEMTAFKASGKPVSELYSDASGIIRQFYIGGWIVGGFIGLTIGGLLAGRLVTRYRTDFEPNRGTCFSCARCVDYCPIKS